MKYVTVLLTKTTHIHPERILAVSPEILHTERDERKSRGPLLARAALNTRKLEVKMRCYV